MGVIALKLFDQPVEVRFNKFRVMLGTIRNCPRSPLGNAICVAQKIVHQFFEPYGVAVDIVDDPHRLILRMLG